MLTRMFTLESLPNILIDRKQACAITVTIREYNAKRLRVSASESENSPSAATKMAETKGACEQKFPQNLQIICPTPLRMRGSGEKGEGNLFPKKQAQLGKNNWLSNR